MEVENDAIRVKRMKWEKGFFGERWLVVANFDRHGVNPIIYNFFTTLFYLHFMLSSHATYKRVYRTLFFFVCFLFGPLYLPTHKFLKLLFAPCII